MSLRYRKAQEYTEKYRGKLVPCKYCGNTDIRIVSDRGIFDNSYCWSVCCSTKNCDFTIDKRLFKAINRWNERHSTRKKRRR